MKKKSKKDQLLVSPEKLAIAAGVFIGVFVLIGFFIFFRGGIELRTALTSQSKAITVTGTVPDGYPPEYVPTVTANAQLNGNTLTVTFDQSQFKNDTGYNNEGNVYGYLVKGITISINGAPKVTDSITISPNGDLEAQPSGELETSHSINIDTNDAFEVEVKADFYFWRKIKMGTIGEGGGSDDCPDKEMSRWACFNSGAMIYYNQDWKDGHLVNGECVYDTKQDWEEWRGSYADDDDVPCASGGECKETSEKVWCEKDGQKANEKNKVQEGPQTDEDWPVFFQKSCGERCNVALECEGDLSCRDVNGDGKKYCAVSCSSSAYLNNGCGCNN